MLMSMSQMAPVTLQVTHGSPIDGLAMTLNHTQPLTAAHDCSCRLIPKGSHTTLQLVLWRWSE